MMRSADFSAKRPKHKPIAAEAPSKPKVPKMVLAEIPAYIGPTMQDVAAEEPPPAPLLEKEQLQQLDAAEAPAKEEPIAWETFKAMKSMYLDILDKTRRGVS